MKILRYCMIAFILFFAVPFFVHSGEVSIDRTEAFNRCLKEMDDIFTQKLVLTGKDGIKVTCIMMPKSEVVCVGWQIENPNNLDISVKPEDMRFYSGDQDFERVNANQAITMMYKWVNEADAYNETQAEYRDLEEWPGEVSREDLMYNSEFPFGDISDPLTGGMTYFVCQVKGLANVMAKLKLNGETFDFTFDGVGP